MDEILKPVNKHMIQLRKSVGLTQAQVAEYLDMKRTTYASMERRGKPAPEVLKKLAKLYKTSSDAILFGDEPNPIFKPTPETVVTFHDHNIFRNSDILPLSTMEANMIRILRNLPKEKANKYIKELDNLYHEQKKSKK